VLDHHAGDHQRRHHRLGLFCGVAEEFRRADLLLHLEPHAIRAGIAGARPRGAGAAALLGHRRLEPRGIHAPPLFAQRVLRQVERKSVGVVQPERHVAGQLLALAQLPRLLGQQPEPAIQHGLEARLLQPQRLGDQRLGAAEFGIRRPHLADQRRDQPPHHRLAGAHHVRMAHRTAHDPPQHVAASFVRRQHAVRHQKCGTAQMIGHHAMAGLERAIRILPRHLGARQDQRPE
jgi:hypothetical protein